MVRRLHGNFCETATFLERKVLGTKSRFLFHFVKSLSSRSKTQGESNKLSLLQKVASTMSEASSGDSDEEPGKKLCTDLHA